MRPARAILYLRRFPMPQAAKKLKRKSEARIRLLSQPPLDWPLAIIVLTLVVFGLVMLFSASYATAYYRFKGDSFHFIRQQALFAAVGVVVMFVASHVDYHIFHKFAWPIMAVTVVLLIVVLFMPELNGAKRWIFLPIGGNLQPSEVAKFAVIVLFAHIISINHKRMKTFAYGVLPFVVILGVIAGLMLLEPHLSGTVLILGIGGLMMFVGGTGLVWFGLAIAGVVAGVAGAVVLVPDLVPYAMSRIESWQNPWLDAQGDGHQIIQSMYAIGSGGLTGLGIGNSKQKHLYLPEPQNDFIFSVIGEEFGFIGCMAVLGLLFFIIVRCIFIAMESRNLKERLIASGVAGMLLFQTFINVGVATGIMPNTGMSLPFVSSGGSSLWTNMAAIGLVLNIDLRRSRTLFEGEY